MRPLYPVHLDSGFRRNDGVGVTTILAYQRSHRIAHLSLVGAGILEIHGIEK